ncbi:2-C-methyl-D-erythritol 4-phosphate cytidylyltransferase [Dysgonomonas mossii]|uniref:2-C-methyl-D-erythritol 4-phosphate cytidylyltransferase n=1 Tax=Dysgonomonas mossii DSM 22836 TaxID=742767 RepID=F8WVY0_9BACT|nr:2-C-methyl-D-erythritol 4-phosphate cytidylyltransferase [Dysgonomonas mossii]EGK06595.1 2-C-methyl-D-erythritol 4-phosphate cytidylyltransferase [Dysgonomonas mossii DSM 22836]
MKKNVIIVAGGKGLRMGNDLPKQFIPIGGKPVLMHTIEAFYRFDEDINIVLVLPDSHQEYWKSLCEEYNFTIEHAIANGGETRFHSVKNGLALVADGLVGVQDGVRPFGSEEMIKRCFDAAREYPAVIPVIDSTDSLREVVDEDKSRIVDRSKIRLVQTPQVFEVDILKKAYQTDFKETFTDDASVVEAMGVNVHLVKGEVTNIKITTPLDLKIGELIVRDKE